MIKNVFLCILFIILIVGVFSFFSFRCSSQVDPFQIRYCPYQPSDEGVYIVKVFAATQARFWWEISWQVTMENTGEVFRGDFSTKLMFRWDKETSQFHNVYSENLVNLTAPCFPCTTISRSSWTQLQIIGNSAFWPLKVTGAPYYISDSQGRQLASSGKVCGKDLTHPSECYQTLTDGIYILRLGGGLFGRQLGFPLPTAKWEGCGSSGTYLDQLIFTIRGGQCEPLQKYHYSGRCDRPPPLNTAALSSTLSPTFGGTVSPSQNIFGEPFVKGEMYAVQDGDKRTNKHERIDPNLLKEESIQRSEESGETTNEIVQNSATTEDFEDEKRVEKKEQKFPSEMPSHAMIF
jgi:hypothetical protein